ncbi:MAG: hypothetical protein AB4426_02170 [Xenococcaceae cyanobacterium]
MRTKILTTAALLTTISLMISAPLKAQNPPASTYQPGFWQPVARVDLNRPLEIKLINQTPLVLEYDLTTNRQVSPQQLLPEKTAVLKELPLPAYLLINAESSNSQSPLVNLKYEVAVTDDNVVTVKIKEISDDIPGDTTLNLHETGAIYIY